MLRRTRWLAAPLLLWASVSLADAPRTAEGARAPAHPDSARRPGAAADATSAPSGTPDASTAPGNLDEDGLVFGSDLNLDPIGVTEAEQLDDVALPKPDAGASRPTDPPKRPLVEGAVLTAIRAVREADHQLNVRLEAGLAYVEAALRFESSADEDGEVRYRLPLPEGAVLAGHAHERPPANALAAEVDARLTRETRGPVLTLRAGPVRRGAPLTVRVRYVVPIRQHAGVVRLTLPARGMDARAAPADVVLSAPGLVGLSLAGAPPGDVPVRLDPWHPCAISGRIPSQPPLRGHAQRHACGTRHCLRAYLSAASAPGTPRHVVLAVDVSPSTEGPARNHLPAALAALLTTAPQGSRVQALAYASTARVLLDTAQPVDQVPLGVLARAPRKDLGGATRLDAVWAMAERWLEADEGLSPLVVLVGDGGLTLGEDPPLAEALARGVEVSVLNVGRRPTHPVLAERVRASGGVVVEAGAAAEDASRGRAVGALEEQAARLFAPVALERVPWAGDDAASRAPLRAGESRVLTRRLRHPPPRVLRGAGLRIPVEPAAAAWTDGLAALADTARGRTGTPARPAPAGSGAATSARQPDADQATETASSGQPPGDQGHGMPASPLLGMLRRRIIPVARGCFRRDRGGRLDYAVRAVFDFELADREVVSARIRGDVGPALRRCLLRAVDTLDVPRFTGRVRVRYPLTTERHPPPPVIELHEDTAHRVDTLFGAEPATPPPSPGHTP